MRSRAAALACLLAFAALAECAAAPDRSADAFRLNETMILQLEGPAEPAACEPAQVLPALFRQIAPRAHVLPTENYYYFDFYRGGRSYSGSLRLAADNRDDGVLQFNCYETFTSWIDSSRAVAVERELSQADGVGVTRDAPFQYRVSFEGLAVTFLLNRLDQSPNPVLLEHGERFAGRIFDESGIRFDLVYNQPLKLFYFLLDTTVPVADGFVRDGADLYVGKRTGFVFYRDRARDRLILVAVHASSLMNNSPYDGPFDQLPENFYEQLGFWDYVYDANPELRGRLTRGGTYRDTRLIFAILPYRSYVSSGDLRFARDCVRRNESRVRLLRCLVT